MIVFKSCVRCQGDVHVKSDQHGEYLDFLQCGATTDIPNRIDFGVRAEIAYSPLGDRSRVSAITAVVNPDIGILSLPTLRIIGI